MIDPPSCPAWIVASIPADAVSADRFVADFGVEGECLDVAAAGFEDGACGSVFLGGFLKLSEDAPTEAASTLGGVDVPTPALTARPYAPSSSSSIHRPPGDARIAVQPTIAAFPSTADTSDQEPVDGTTSAPLSGRAARTRKPPPGRVFAVRVRSPAR
jgi:hypothetical protein